MLLPAGYAAQVSGEEYGEEELDPEWMALLADLDARLQVGARRGAVAPGQLVVGSGARGSHQCVASDSLIGGPAASNAAEQLPPAAQLSHPML